jgi:hypothetical protein
MSTDGAAPGSDELLIEQASRVLTGAFAQHQLQRMLDLLKQVQDDGPLRDDDSAFLEDVLAALARTHGLRAHHPDVETLHRCALGLYDDIMTAAQASVRLRAAACR